MSSPLSPGTQLGRYEILSQLGVGGMGEVYLAEDKKLERRVALKILPADMTAHHDRMRRFVLEAKAVSALNHPNIITIFEIEQIDSVNFIATEFIDGETLRQRLRGVPMKLGEVLDVGGQIASALAAAHAAGIVHRDIKPENVMLRRDGIVKVLDFGLAKLTERPPPEWVDPEAPTSVKTDPGTVVGTPIYMSPEQARGFQVDARTDIFSLGVLVYEMVAGRLPFDGSHTNEILAAILSDKEPAPLARFTRQVPAELERIVAKALHKNREERYQTIKDMQLDLKSLKHRLDFDAEVERSQPPEMSSERTTAAAAPSTVGGPTAQTMPVTESLAHRANHKRSLIIALPLLIVAVASLTYRFYLARPAPAIDSIAVLPFVNSSNDANAEYLSDGISEALINSLTELQGLRVIARSTAFHYKGKEVDPQAVGRELNVRAVLMGQVRQMGDTLNIQVDLVDTTTGAQLWGQEYERNASDVLSVKQAIAREVTEKLSLRLSEAQQQRLVKRDTTNAEAYQFYLRGRYFWNKRTAQGIEKAIDQFQQAIDRDPNYALGYVGLADCYGLLEEYAGVPASETLPKARAAADRALQIDDSLSEGHASSGLVFQQMWRWAETEEEFKRAISLNPNYPTAHHWLSIYFRAKGQLDDSLREINRAQELDPLSPVIGQNIAEIDLLKNDLSTAIAQCQRIIELDPNFPGAHDELGFAYLKQRRYEEAIAEFQKTVALSGNASRYQGDLGYCYAVTGRRAEAQAILKELEVKYARREAVGQYLADVYAGLGDRDQAFSWLQRDIERGSGIRLPFIKWWFTFDSLRSDPRYADLVRRMGLKP
ncbi:MAG TPA: protein kinase [Pyrinomonadaceae bacterium]|nr:protein kinase [Pyrinomonadaceae bacterium]